MLHTVWAHQWLELWPLRFLEGHRVLLCFLLFDLVFVARPVVVQLCMCRVRGT